MFYRARAFTNETGIGIDLSPENIYWGETRWVLNEAKLRISERPYRWTLDIGSFEEFYELLMEEDSTPVREYSKGQELMAAYQKIADQSSNLWRLLEEDEDSMIPVAEKIAKDATLNRHRILIGCMLYGYYGFV